MKKKFVVYFIAVLFLLACGNDKWSVNEIDSHPNSVSHKATESPRKPKINVFVENSKSMFGYVSTGNDFDRSISSLLTNIKVSEYSDSINLHYINSKTFRQNLDIPSFIKKTNIHNAQSWSGNLARTDMCVLLDTVTSYVNDTTLSIFVSDCIFSPGNYDAKRDLGKQKDCITLTINEKLRSQNFAFIAYRLISEFNGNYYDCQNKATLINNQRPYFIWVIGTKENIASFKQKISRSKIEGQLINTYTIFKSEKNIKYAVQLNPRIGSFHRPSPTSIKKTRKDKDLDKFTFTVGVDFSSLLVDEAYLTTPENYKISNPNYTIEITKRQMGFHTHLISITTTAEIISPTKLTIELINKIPDWVEEFSDESCTTINTNGMMQKTFGLKQIMQGIYAAYNYDDDVLSEMVININQNQ